MARSELNLVELMQRELGIHPENGRRLLAAGYVHLDGHTLGAGDAQLEVGEATGKMLTVLNRSVRVVGPTQLIEAQGGLF